MSRRRILWIVSSVLVAAGLLSVSFWGIRIWRAHHLVNGAVRAMDAATNEQEALAAWDRARAGYQLQPNRLSVVRSVARIASRVHPESAVRMWEQAVVLSDGKFSDRIELARAYLAVGRIPDATNTLNGLQEAFSDRAELWYLKSRIARNEGEIEVADEAARKMVELPDATLEHVRYFVEVSFRSPVPGANDRAIRMLDTLLDRDPEAQVAAARFLIDFDVRDESLLQKAADRLIEGEHDRDVQLLGYVCQLRADPTTQGAVIDAVVSLFDLTSGDELVEAARWFNAQRLPAQTTHLISTERALERRDAFLARADALALLGEWEQLHRELQARRVPLENYIGSVYRMRAAFEGGNPHAARLEWERALVDAGHDANRLWFLVRYTSALGYRAQEEAALRRLTEQPASARAAHLRLLQLLQNDGNTRGMRDQLQQMRNAFPEDLAVANDLAFMNLILNERVSEARRELESILDKTPQVFAPNLTYGLALLREGKATEALRHLQRLNVDWDRVSVRARAVLVAVLREAGEKRWADRYAQDLNAENLLPEEQSLAEGSAGAEPEPVVTD